MGQAVQALNMEQISPELSICRTLALKGSTIRLESKKGHWKTIA